MGRLAAAWNTLVGKSAGPIGVSDSRLVTLFNNGQTPRKGTRELLASYSQTPWLRAVAHKLGVMTAAIPWQLYAVRTGRGPAGKRFIRPRTLQAADGMTRRKLLQQARIQGNLVEIDTHPLLDVLDRPNPEMTGQVLGLLTQVWLDVVGGCLQVIERNPAGMPVQLWPIPPHWVVGLPGPHGNFFRVAWGTMQLQVAAEDAVWLRDPDPSNPYLRGVGVGTALADEIDTDEWAAKRTKAWFQNGSVPDLIVGVKGAAEPKLKEAQANFEGRHRGVVNAFRTWWTGAEVNVTRLDSSFKDQQLVQLRQFQRDTVVQVFGIPPEAIGIIENSNRATIDAADLLLAKNCLVPRKEFQRSEYQARLVPQYDDRLLLDYANPIPEDRDFKLKVMQAAPSKFSGNEVRGLAGYEPVDGEDDLQAPPAAPPPAPLAGPPGDEDAQERRADPPWVRALPAGRPAPQAKTSARDVENALEALRPERLRAELDPVFQEQIDSWAKDVLQDLGAAARFDLLNPLIAVHMEEMGGERIRGITNTTRTMLRETLVEGIQEGEDIRDLAKRVRDTMDGEIARSRARTIARTETIRSSNWATHEAHKASGVVDTRKWIATADSRTRYDHDRLANTVVPLTQRFQLDGHWAWHPGGFGVAALDINCRCTTVAVIQDPKAIGLEPGTAYDLRSGTVMAKDQDPAAVWTKFDQRVTPWEQAAEDAVLRGFAAQLEDVLAALGDK